MPGDNTHDLDQPFGIELRGAPAGINPMFGEWQQKFDFAPVPYRDGGTKTRAFANRIRTQSKNIRWMYSREVRLEIVFYLDIQNVLESSETADLDNYAKSILDALKRPEGIMFDDTQVQALSISWIDTYKEPYFTISAQSSPDDFILKPVGFYEMPNGLWYPHSRLLWRDGKAEPADHLNYYFGLSISELMSSVRKNVRHQLRRNGSSRLEAFRVGEYFSTNLRGYHRSRIDAGFTMHPRRQWQQARREWQLAHPADSESSESMLTDLRQVYDKLVSEFASNEKK